MANFEPAFSDEMAEQIVLDVYEYVKAGELSVKKVIGVSREMIEKRDDEGNLVYYDIRVEGKDKPIILDTMIGRIRIIVAEWKKYVAPLMQTMVLEAVYQHALKGKDNVASFKAASEMIMSKESADDGDKLAVPPSVNAILQSAPVGTTIIIGQDCLAQGVGDKGHEGADRVHPMAHGQRQETPAEAIPCGHDKPVHGMSKGGNTSQGSLVPDTPLPPEDAVDNDSGDDMGVTERSRRVSSY